MNEVVELFNNKKNSAMCKDIHSSNIIYIKWHLALATLLQCNEEKKKQEYKTW